MKHNPFQCCIAALLLQCRTQICQASDAHDETDSRTQAACLIQRGLSSWKRQSLSAEDSSEHQSTTDATYATGEVPSHTEPRSGVPKSNGFARSLEEPEFQDERQILRHALRKIEKFDNRANMDAADTAVGEANYAAEVIRTSGAKASLISALRKVEATVIGAAVKLGRGNAFLPGILIIAMACSLCIGGACCLMSTSKHEDNSWPSPGQRQSGIPQAYLGWPAITWKREEIPLCPELVVPCNGECCLLMPSILFAFQSQAEAGAGPQTINSQQMTINDPTGNPVFRVSIEPPMMRRHGSNGNGHKSVVLSSAIHERIIFAYLGEAEELLEEGYPLLKLYQHPGSLYGSLQRSADVNTWSMSSIYGWQLRFIGSFKDGALTVVDGTNKLQAKLNAHSSDSHASHSVRIGPGVDVGLIVLSLLGIQMLEAKTSGALLRAGQEHTCNSMSQ